MDIEKYSFKRNMVKQTQGWNCEHCTYLNSELLDTCQLCGENNNSEAFQVCQFCGQENPINSKQCSVCLEVFKDIESQEKVNMQLLKKESQIIYCTLCRFQNHKENQICLSCEEPLKQIKFDKNETEICPICAMVLKNKDTAQQHMIQCEQSQQMIEKLEKQELLLSEKLAAQSQFLSIKPIRPIKPKPYIKSDIKPLVSKSPTLFSRPTTKPVIVKTKNCPICNTSIIESLFDTHLSQCKYEPIDIQSIIKSKPTLMSLTPLQESAVSFMHSSSKTKHDKARTQLQVRIKRLGFKENDLEALEHYVQNYAPIIVHIHITRHMEFFVKDTHYRNQFQTGKSSGSLSRESRIQWENRMFSRKYQNAKDFERVKYGTINFTNDPAGVSACRTYGNSYFLLKSDVRQRCTFTDQDSSAANSLIGTFKYGDHILVKLSDNQLKAAINAAKANEVSSSVVTTYKEIQIHGPIEFARDIQRLYVNKTELTDARYKNMVEQFSARFGVDYQIF